jgi:hypothetical protein
MVDFASTSCAMKDYRSIALFYIPMMIEVGARYSADLIRVIKLQLHDLIVCESFAVRLNVIPKLRRCGDDRHGMRDMHHANQPHQPNRCITKRKRIGPPTLNPSYPSIVAGTFLLIYG